MVQSSLVTLMCILIISVPWSFQQDYSDADNLQNELRSQHSAPPLNLTDDLNAVAQKRANTVAANNQLSHDPNLGYGENLAWFSQTLGASDAANQSVQMWYNEVSSYDYNNPGFSSKTGHFTQVVWVSTERVGFGVQTASDGSTYVSAVYDPPGNYEGEFRQNVLPN